MTAGGTAGGAQERPGMADESSRPVDEHARYGGRWLAASVLLVFGLFYAWDVFEAIANLRQLVEYVAVLNARDAELIDAGVSPAAVPWVPAVTVILLPLLAFVTALVLGRGRGPGTQVLCLAGGLAVVAALTLSLTALA